MKPEKEITKATTEIYNWLRHEGYDLQDAIEVANKLTQTIKTVNKIIKEEEIK